MCCDNMKFFVNYQDFDCIIKYNKKFDEYAIAVNDGGTSVILIQYCPWCGKKLPTSKREKWFEELEKIGIDNPFEDQIPIEFKSDIWWKKRNL